MTPQPFLSTIKLPRTSLLGDFVEDALIPYVFGDHTDGYIRCGRLNELEFVVAAHPMEITGVLVEGLTTSGWEPFTKTADGKTFQCLRLAAPTPQTNNVVLVKGRGMLNSRGRLIENPADILKQIALLQGREEVAFINFREDCAKKGWKLAGIVSEEKTVRAIAQDILDSCGAVWAGSDVVFLGVDGDYARPVRIPGVAKFTADLETTCQKLTLAFNWDFSSGESRSYVTMACGTLATDREAKVFAKWLKKRNLAMDLGRRLIAEQGGERLFMEAAVPGLVRAGEYVYVSDQKFNGRLLVTEAAITDAETAIKGYVQISPATKIRLDHSAFGLQTKEREKIDIAFKDGVLTITVYDSDSKPLPGVFLSLDKGAAKQSDNSGKVQFTKVKPGSHILDINPPGHQPIIDLPIEVQ